jgi:hypothetical protein
MLASKCFKRLLRPGQGAYLSAPPRPVAQDACFYMPCLNHDMSIAESPEFSQTAGLQFAKRRATARFYDFAHLTGRLPCANLGGELNISIGGTNGESRCNTGAVPQLYS